jgi:hypothetical protein
LHNNHPPARPPWWIRAADLIAGALFALALVSIVTGGGRISLGGLVLSVTRPQPPLIEASVILLIRAVIWRGAGAIRRLPLVLILAVFMVGLVSDSTPRRVGDASEYMAMAMSLGRLSGPAVAASDIDDFSYAVWARDYGFTMVSPGLRGQDTRQDFTHFWFYPLLAASFVRLAEAAGAHPNYGFAALNVLLLLATTGAMPVSTLRACSCGGRANHLVARQGAHRGVHFLDARDRIDPVKGLALVDDGGVWRGGHAEPAIRRGACPDARMGGVRPAKA